MVLSSVWKPNNKHNTECCYWCHFFPLRRWYLKGFKARRRDFKGHGLLCHPWFMGGSQAAPSSLPIQSPPPTKLLLSTVALCEVAPPQSCSFNSTQSPPFENWKNGCKYLQWVWVNSDMQWYMPFGNWLLCTCKMYSDIIVVASQLSHQAMSRTYCTLCTCAFCMKMIDIS